MSKDEALRLALKAMKVNNSAWKSLADSGDAGNWEAEEQGYYQLNEQAINAVEAALEAKDEPVAWRWMPAVYWKQWVYSDDGARVEEAKRFMGDGGVQPLYTTSPQRKPLTDEEIHQIFIANSVVVDNGNAYMVAGLRALNITRAIEAAHGIKGEA